jgi:ADP-ribose pyrophosphatase YjhB (NUDIX family)
MSYEADAHKHQMITLRHLLLRPDAGFSELQKMMSAESDAANFHIKQLVNAGYITKVGRGRYKLTMAGKEYANRMDTDEQVIEKQAKVAACLLIRREDGKELIQQRLKQPYYGYYGRPTGKIRWGETILEGAARELMEETGLRADMVYDSIIHKMDYNKETNELLEDKVFFMVRCKNLSGELIEVFEGGQNVWMTPDEYASQPLTFAETKDLFAHNAPKIAIVEDRIKYDPDHY